LSGSSLVDARCRNQRVQKVQAHWPGPVDGPELQTKCLLVIPGQGRSQNQRSHSFLQAQGCSPVNRGTLQPKELGALRLSSPFAEQAPVLLFAHLGRRLIEQLGDMELVVNDLCLRRRGAGGRGEVAPMSIAAAATFLRWASGRLSTKPGLGSVSRPATTSNTRCPLRSVISET